MKDKEIRIITERIMALIENCEDGDSATMAELVRETGAGANDFDIEDMFEIQTAVFDAAKERGINLDMSEHEGKFEGMPFQLEFVINRN
ncbi:MAG: hypothetical protein HUJ98_08950 [Bacteroidaceae bacterium]|nr:hypothetical protein [Bacteroidaceae bacterium]